MKPGTTSIALTGILAAAVALPAAEFHVALTGDDDGRGTRQSPLRTIQRAADLAQPGDVVTVHAGTYRERINPPRGGASDRERIVYRAAPGEPVEIKGSEVVRGWVPLPNEVWKVVLPNYVFGRFNPYRDLIHGDWFNPKGREHHTGAVYLNGDWLTESATLEAVLKPTGDTPLWFAAVEATNTTLWAQFRGVNPNAQRVEINVRPTVFYPDQPGRNYITVRGFTLQQAATPWAPPTAEQIGLIGTHWSRGWIIESNVVSHSICSGIALGKHGDQFDNTSADTAEGYVKTIERAQAHAIAWTRENIGHHVVRNNTISHCEQAGIVGSLGAAFSTVEGNVIHDIHGRRLFTGAEMAGIKLHAAIDTTIRGNHIYNNVRGLWLDWMAQGARVSQNLCHDNASEDLFVEVNHGPFVVDNNLLLSPTSVLDMSEGGAYAHNLFAGKISNRPEPGRATPFHPAHSTAVAGLVVIQGGDDRFYNNIFVGTGEPSTRARPATGNEPRWISCFGLEGYDTSELPLQTGGNVYFHGARPYATETNRLTRSDYNPGLRLVEEQGRVVLHLALEQSVRDLPTPLVTTALLGKAKIPGLPYVNPDDSPLTLDRDYFGQRRSHARPTPGPFENPGEGNLKLEVW